VSRNITDALTDVLADILERGSLVVARGQEQREVLSTLVKIERPAERVLTIPGRNNNVFAQIAETLWVMAGRDDLAFLSRYLPRAVDFSDDGATWRAAYGPRLRAWGSRVDQLATVKTRIDEDPNTKRAVVSIFDPGSDHIETKDVPCNNWLQFIHRDGTLNLNVAVRANDAIWGFSGINVFEWSVLQELMAKATNNSVGTLSWFVGTLHVYSRHYTTAERILHSRGIKSCYEFGFDAQPITIGLDELDDELQKVFLVEDLARRGDHQDAARHMDEICDPFFRSCAVMLRAYNAFLQDDQQNVLRIIDELPGCDFRIAAMEFFSRKWRVRDLITRNMEGEYLRYYWALSDATSAIAV
jgi:thymidylate synthase